MSPADDPAELPAREPRSADAEASARLVASADPVSASELVERLDFAERAHAAPLRPYVILNMVSTVDGRASIGGRSGAIGGGGRGGFFHPPTARGGGVGVSAARA